MLSEEGWDPKAEEEGQASIREAPAEVDVDLDRHSLDESAPPPEDPDDDDAVLAAIIKHDASVGLPGWERVGFVPDFDLHQDGTVAARLAMGSRPPDFVPIEPRSVRVERHGRNQRPWLIEKGARSSSGIAKGHSVLPAMTNAFQHFAAGFGRVPRMDRCQMLITFTTFETIVWLVEQP